MSSHSEFDPHNKNKIYVNLINTSKGQFCQTLTRPGCARSASPMYQHVSVETPVDSSTWSVNMVASISSFLIVVFTTSSLNTTALSRFLLEHIQMTQMVNQLKF